MPLDTSGRRSTVLNQAGNLADNQAAPRVTGMVGTPGVPRNTSSNLGRVSMATIAIPSAQTIAARIDHVVEEIVRDQGALRRTLPDVAAEAMEMCGRAGGDAAKIERTLTRDPFISAQVVSIANSAMFSPKMPILGVRDAVVRIGLDAVRDVVVMVVANSTMFRVRGFEKQIDGFRRRMLASASASRFLAKAVHAESEYGFLAGLLHDVGELVMLERCAMDGLITAQSWDDPVEGALVRERIFTHHASVGATLCRSWKLPTGVVDAAQFHHDYHNDGKAHLAAHLVAASDVLCDYLLPGQPPPAMPANEQPIVLELGLTPAQIPALVEEARVATLALIGK